MGRKAKIAIKVVSTLGQTTFGVLKGVYSVGNDAKNLVFGNNEILDLQQKLNLNPDAELSTRTERGEHITMDFITALIIDSFLFKADVEKIYQQTL